MSYIKNSRGETVLFVHSDMDEIAQKVVDEVFQPTQP